MHLLDNLDKRGCSQIQPFCLVLPVSRFGQLAVFFAFTVGRGFGFGVSIRSILVFAITGSAHDKFFFPLSLNAPRERYSKASGWLRGTGI